MPRHDTHTTACKTSSVLLSPPALAGFLPLAGPALFFPFCDMSSGAGRAVRRGCLLWKESGGTRTLSPRKAKVTQESESKFLTDTHRR